MPTFVKSAAPQPATMLPHKGAWRTAAKSPAVTPTPTAATAGGDRELDGVGAGLAQCEAGDRATVEGDPLHARRLPLGDWSM